MSPMVNIQIFPLHVLLTPCFHPRLNLMSQDPNKIISQAKRGRKGEKKERRKGGREKGEL